MALPKLRYGSMQPVKLRELILQLKKYLALCHAPVHPNIVRPKW